jgi:hypothetical protein
LPPTTANHRSGSRATQPKRAFLWLGIFGAPAVCASCVQLFPHTSPKKNAFALLNTTFSDTSFGMKYTLLSWTSFAIVSASIFWVGFEFHRSLKIFAFPIRKPKPQWGPQVECDSEQIIDVNMQVQASFVGDNYHFHSRRVFNVDAVREQKHVTLSEFRLPAPPRNAATS